MKKKRARKNWTLRLRQLRLVWNYEQIQTWNSEHKNWLLMRVYHERGQKKRWRMVKSETETKQAKLRDRNKCTINETARLYAKDVEISRSDEKCTRPKILEVPFATPRRGNAIKINVLCALIHLSPVKTYLKNTFPMKDISINPEKKKKKVEIIPTLHL